MNATGSTTTREHECQSAPVDQGDDVVAASAILESDDDDEWDGENMWVPVGAGIIHAAPESSVSIPQTGLMASPGIFDTLYRPPRSIA